MRFYTASAVLASAGTALAVGSANIVNHCPYDVNVVSVSDQPGPMHQLSANGGSYSEPFRQNPNKGGISMKVSKGNDQNDIVSQFEYTYNPPDNPYPGVFWDLSLINGNVFKDTNVAIVPVINSGDAGGSCTKVTCPEGTSCKDAYLQPDDNAATHQCPADTDLTYYLCSDGSNSGSSGNSGSSSPSPAPQSSPAPQPPAQSPAPQPSPTPAPSPSPAPAPSPVASPAGQQLNQKPAESSPAPKPASNPFVLSWSEGDGVVKEMPHHKRSSHLEAHNRIRRMHHARSIE